MTTLDGSNHRPNEAANLWELLDLLDLALIVPKRRAEDDGLPSTDRFTPQTISVVRAADTSAVDAW